MFFYILDLCGGKSSSLPLAMQRQSLIPNTRFIHVISDRHSLSKVWTQAPLGCRYLLNNNLSAIIHSWYQNSHDRFYLPVRSTECGGGAEADLTPQHYVRGGHIT